MRFARILFVVPFLRGIYGWPAQPHTGIGSLVSYLTRKGIRCSVIDMNLGHSFSEFRSRVDCFEPDLIGISLYTYRFDRSNKFVRRVKRACSTPIVIGGPHVSLFRKQAVRWAGADYGVKQEGELTLEELCAGRDMEEIAGLIYRTPSGVTVENTDRPFLSDLDSLPFPTYEGFELSQYGRAQINIVSSRGCPYRCTFCPIRLSMGQRYRCRSAAIVVEELAYWYARGYRNFSFVDDNFTLHQRRIYELCDRIEKRNWDDIHLSCCQGIRADCVDRALLERLTEVGLEYLALGVESASDRVLQHLRKGESVTQIEAVVKDCCELGLEVGLFFLVGSPYETTEDVQESFAFCLKYPVMYANFYNVIPFPGTSLYRWVEQNGLFLVPPEEYMKRIMHFSRKPVFRNLGMDDGQLRGCFRQGARLERVVRRRFFERKAGSRWLAKLLAWLVYGRVGYAIVRRMQSWRTMVCLKNRIAARLQVQSRSHTT